MLRVSSHVAEVAQHSMQRRRGGRDAKTRHCAASAASTSCLPGMLGIAPAT